MLDRKALFSAAERLHFHLLRHHQRAGELRGPDPGIRLNLRAWRFFKSALDFVPWRDDYLFMQTQGYWVLANWMLFETTRESRYRELAIKSAEKTLGLETREGCWVYPLPGWRHRVATVEGNWGAIALLATHAREARRELLNGAINWYAYLVNRIGFQPHSPGEAINYFDRPRGKIPNNSVEAAWLFLRLWKATGQDRFLEHVDEMLQFIAAVQLPSGELPYIVENAYEKARDHYLCFQYNAFQFLKLAWLTRLKSDTQEGSILPALATFLKKGVTKNGASARDCFHTKPELDYYTAALAAALYEAARMGVAEAADLSERCYARVLARQRADGSFGFSTGDYAVLRDSRSYPRQQVMTLFHLLYGCSIGDGFP